MGRIVEAQIHSAAPGKGNWDPDPEQRTRVHHFPERDEVIAEMDAAGVDAAILVPPLGWSEAPDNEPWLADVAAHPERFAVFGRFRPEDGPRHADLAELASRPGLRGVRLSIHDRRGNSAVLTDGSLDWFWDSAQSLGLPVMINAPERYAELYDVAATHPGLRIIVDHLGLRPDLRYDDLMPPLRRLVRLAVHANVSVKASALPDAVNEPYPFPSVKPALRAVIDEFGAARVFWGSDLSRLPCTYRDLVRFFAEDLDFLSDADRADILGEAILKWISWDPAPVRLS